uniref:AlNc14C309G10474 protein n=1 Tax=Albugo laibachii Nc14 TaxID=890382 RepID=F0WW26_9STRA|nr:AlNc14C309G10474 [Albugo laibachii Nc14]|eukprot:CCA25629.1 AlNc14C309G10474 [Albugo laibachii Nc14]
MGLDDLLPGNTKRARATAVNAFLRFIQSEDVDLESIILYLAIFATRAGGIGEGLDKRKDSVLTAVIGRNSVVAIVRRVKMCNCVLFPSCRPSSMIRWKAIVVFFYLRTILFKTSDGSEVGLIMGGGGVGEGLDLRNDNVSTAVIGRNFVLAIVRRVKMCNCVLFPSCRPSSTMRWKTIVVFFYVICTTFMERVPVVYQLFSILFKTSDGSEVGLIMVWHIEKTL